MARNDRQLPAVETDSPWSLYQGSHFNEGDDFALCDLLEEKILCVMKEDHFGICVSESSIGETCQKDLA